jgi:hypothetical protein
MFYLEDDELWFAYFSIDERIYRYSLSDDIEESMNIFGNFATILTDVVEHDSYDEISKFIELTFMEDKDTKRIEYILNYKNEWRNNLLNQSEIN